MIIPHQQLSADTLHALADEFVSREGTDYGENEISQQSKVKQVIAQIAQGEAFILYSELHESCTIISKQEMQQRSDPPHHEP
ncbi:MAG: YheU family protein [Gammaproteobacteria bacterium]|nr:YheU family protein [Gammaproteobacteria bacterium]MCF6230469.1 YheU family protein [Gammaproteobacteria bacterium]